MGLQQGQHGPNATGQPNALEEPEVDSFRMKIIYPDEVKEVRFTLAGEPILDNPADQTDLTRGFMTGVNPPDNAETPGGTAETDDEDFPVQFRSR